MDLVFLSMRIIGIVIMVFIVPVCTLATLIMGISINKIKGLLLNLCGFISYFIWAVLIFSIILNCSIFEACPWWIPVFELGLLFGCIPYSIFLIYAIRSRNRLKIYSAIAGLSTTFLLTIGIILFFYSF